MKVKYLENPNEATKSHDMVMNLELGKAVQSQCAVIMGTLPVIGSMKIYDEDQFITEVTSQIIREILVLLVPFLTLSRAPTFSPTTIKQQKKKKNTTLRKKKQRIFSVCSSNSHLKIKSLRHIGPY